MGMIEKDKATTLWVCVCCESPESSNKLLCPEERVLLLFVHQRDPIVHGSKIKLPSKASLFVTDITSDCYRVTRAKERSIEVE